MDTSGEIQKKLLCTALTGIMFLCAGCAVHNDSPAVDTAIQEVLNSTETGYLDVRIEQTAEKYFPRWTDKEKLAWLTAVFPHTDAGSTTALMETAKKEGLISLWDEYADALPDSVFSPEKRENLRSSLGSYITQENWKCELRAGENGRYDLVLTDRKSNAQCLFHTDIPSDKALSLYFCNSDCILWDEKMQEERLCVRRDPFFNIWIESGNWNELEKKDASATYQSLRTAPVRYRTLRTKTQIIQFYGICELPEQNRKKKRGSIGKEEIIIREVKIVVRNAEGGIFNPPVLTKFVNAPAGKLENAVNPEQILSGETLLEDGGPH